MRRIDLYLAEQLKFAVPMKKTCIVSFLLIVFPLLFQAKVSLLAQEHRLYLGTQVPLNYSVGYEYQHSPPLSWNIHTGVLTVPYQTAIAEILKALGTDRALAHTIEDEFDIGYHLQPSLKYYLGRTYLGLSYIYQSLWAKNLSSESIENYYGVQLPSRPFRTNAFTLNSNLHNLGFFVGRIVNLGLTNWQLHLELGAYKTIASESRLNAEFGETSIVNPLIDSELGAYYRKYGYLASANFYLAYHF